MITKYNIIDRFIKLLGISLLQTLLFMFILLVLEKYFNIVYLMVWSSGNLTVGEMGILFFLMILLCDIIVEPIRISIDEHNRKEEKFDKEINKKR